MSCGHIHHLQVMRIAGSDEFHNLFPKTRIFSLSNLFQTFLYYRKTITQTNQRRYGVYGKTILGFSKSFLSARMLNFRIFHHIMRTMSSTVMDTLCKPWDGGIAGSDQILNLFSKTQVCSLSNLFQTCLYCRKVLIQTN